MNTFLEINLYIVLFYLIYKLLLQKNLLPSTKRFILLSIPLLSLGVFWLKNMFIVHQIVVETPVFVLETFTVGQQAAESIHQNYISLNLLYWIGAALSLAFLTYKLIKTLWIFRSGKSLKEHKHIITSNLSDENFSFFHFIHLNPSMSEKECDMVLQHEKYHIKQWHSLDILYYEICKVVFWFNPFVYLLKNELECVHEEEVDLKMHQAHGEHYIHSMLSINLNTKADYFSISNQFLNPKFNLKTRINMMKTKRKHYRLLLLTIPALALMLGGISCKNDSNTVVPVTEDVKRKTVENDSIYEIVDRQAEYPGGFDQLYAYLGSELKYPEELADNSVEGKVYVQFVIEKNGMLSNVEVLNKGKTHIALENEAMRVISEMNDWLPAEHEGKNVRSKFVLPVNFKFSEK